MGGVLLALRGFFQRSFLSLAIWHPFFSNRDARLLMRGNFSERILLKQGVPQGDIISPYIFVLAVEVVLIKLNYTKNITGIKGITYSKREARSEAFADDASVFMLREEGNLRNAIMYLRAFSKISGLH